jgi:hypothetical protein
MLLSRLPLTAIPSLQSLFLLRVFLHSRSFIAFCVLRKRRRLKSNIAVTARRTTQSLLPRSIPLLKHAQHQNRVCFRSESRTSSSVVRVAGTQISAAS